MKFFSYFYFLMLCSTGYLHAMDTIHFSSSQTSCKIKRAELTKQIRTIKNDINNLNQDNEQNLALHKQLYDLLKKKKATYLNTNCSQYKECTTEIKRIEKIITEHPQDLTVSTIATKNLELATLEAAQLKTLAEEKEKQALKKLEAIIISKIKNISLLNKFDLEQLIIEQENSSISPEQKQRLLKIFEIKTLWFASEEKTIELFTALQNITKGIITNIYAQWLKEYAGSPSWLENSESDHTRDLKTWGELDETFGKLKTNISKLPIKSVQYNDQLDQFKKERIDLLIKIMELENRIKINSDNIEIKQMLADKLKEIILSIHDEWAHNKTKNKSGNSLYWIKKYLSITNLIQKEDQNNNFKPCIIL